MPAHSAWLVVVDERRRRPSVPEPVLLAQSPRRWRVSVSTIPSLVRISGAPSAPVPLAPAFPDPGAPAGWGPDHRLAAQFTQSTHTSTSTSAGSTPPAAGQRASLLLCSMPDCLGAAEHRTGPVA